MPALAMTDVSTSQSLYLVAIALVSVVVLPLVPWLSSLGKSEPEKVPSSTPQSVSKAASTTVKPAALVERPVPSPQMLVEKPASESVPSEPVKPKVEEVEKVVAVVKEPVPASVAVSTPIAKTTLAPVAAAAPISSTPIEKESTRAPATAPAPVEKKETTPSVPPKTKAAETNKPASPKRKLKKKKSSASIGGPSKPSKVAKTDSALTLEAEPEEDDSPISDNEEDSIADLLLLQSLSSKNNANKNKSVAHKPPKAIKVVRQPSTSKLPEQPSASQLVAAPPSVMANAAISSTETDEKKTPEVPSKTIKADDAVVEPVKSTPPSLQQTQARSRPQTNKEKPESQPVPTPAAAIQHATSVDAVVTQTIASLQAQLRATSEKLNAETSKYNMLASSMETFKTAIAKLEAEKAEIANSNRALASYAQSTTARLAEAEGKSNATIVRVQSMLDAKTEEAARLKGILSNLEARLESERKGLTERHAMEVITLQERIASISATSDDKVNRISSIYEDRMAQFQKDAANQLNIAVAKAVEQAKRETADSHMKDLKRAQIESSVAAAKVNVEVEELKASRDKLTAELKAIKDAQVKESKLVQEQSKLLKQKEAEIAELKKASKVEKEGKGSKDAVNVSTTSVQAQVAAYEVIAAQQSVIASLSGQMEGVKLAAAAANVKAAANKAQKSAPASPKPAAASVPKASLAPADNHSYEVIAAQASVISSLARTVETLKITQAPMPVSQAPTPTSKSVTASAPVALPAPVRPSESAASITKLKNELKNIREIRSREANISALQGRMIVERDRALESLKSNISQVKTLEAALERVSKAKGLLESEVEDVKKDLERTKKALEISKVALKASQEKVKSGSSSPVTAAKTLPVSKHVPVPEAVSKPAAAVAAVGTGAKASLGNLSGPGVAMLALKKLNGVAAPSTSPSVAPASKAASVEQPKEQVKHKEPTTTTIAASPQPATKKTPQSANLSSLNHAEIAYEVAAASSAVINHFAAGLETLVATTEAAKAKKPAEAAKPKNVSSSLAPVPAKASPESSKKSVKDNERAISEAEAVAAQMSIISSLAASLEGKMLAAAAASSKPVVAEKASKKVVAATPAPAATVVKPQQPSLVPEHYFEVMEGQSKIISSLATSLEDIHLSSSSSSSSTSKKAAAVTSNKAEEAQKKLEAIQQVLAQAEKVIPAVGPGPFPGAHAVRRLEKQVSSIEPTRGSNWKLV
ncbi:hypothetical protein HDV05_003014 [Chytridiales sp. JEL 0842]|nr:hypothetical protein HDV05_003014 [Chytridiales sp. JEL 0842]